MIHNSHTSSVDDGVADYSVNSVLVFSLRFADERTGVTCQVAGRQLKKSLHSGVLKPFIKAMASRRGLDTKFFSTEQAKLLKCTGVGPASAGFAAAMNQKSWDMPVYLVSTEEGASVDTGLPTPQAYDQALPLAGAGRDDDSGVSLIVAIPGCPRRPVPADASQFDTRAFVHRLVPDARRSRLVFYSTDPVMSGGKRLLQRGMSILGDSLKAGRAASRRAGRRSHNFGRELSLAVDGFANILVKNSEKLRLPECTLS